MRSFSVVIKQFQVTLLMLCLGFGLYAAGCGPFSLGRNVPPEVTPEASSEPVEYDDNSPQSDRGLNDPVSEPPTSVPSGDTLLGYRVQLYSFSSREAAEAAIRRVERLLADWSHGVYLSEEDGSFKVRVGDFTDKDEANLLRDRLREEGYPDAWTASARVRLP